MLIRACALFADRPGGEHRWQDGLFRISAGHIFRVEEDCAAPATASHHGWLLPGLVDAHCHIGYSADGPVDALGMERQAWDNFLAGVTLIRDCGSPVDNCAVAQNGPIGVLRAGQHIARPKRYIRNLAVEAEPAALVETVIAQAQAGSGWVKLVGDWIDRADGNQSDLRPLWPASQLREAVAAAHDLGARVSVHTFGRDTIDGLLEAGVDSIEHGTGMEPDQVREAARRGISVTPTLLQVGLFPEFAQAAGSKYPVYAQTMTDLFTSHEDVWGSFLDAGVTLLPGTDSGGYQRHGCLPLELERWVMAGMETREVLDAATWKARAFLGTEGLYHGAPADFVLYGEDPRADITVLQRPRLIHTPRASWEY